MTVFNTGYCSIDEAWGDLNGKNSKSKKKKSPQDPMCDLYEAKLNSNYNDTDIVRFANEYYDKFDKSKYQRTMKTQSMAYEELEREPSPKTLLINKTANSYDITNGEQKKPVQRGSALFEKQFEMKLPPLYDTDDECQQNQNQSQNTIDKKYNSKVISEKPRYKKQEYDEYDYNADQKFIPSPFVESTPTNTFVDDMDYDRLFMGMPSTPIHTFAEVNSEQCLTRPSSAYKLPVTMERNYSDTRPEITRPEKMSIRQPIEPPPQSLSEKVMSYFDGNKQNSGNTQNSGNRQNSGNTQNSGNRQNSGNTQNSGNRQNSGNTQNSGSRQNSGIFEEENPNYSEDDKNHFFDDDYETYNYFKTYKKRNSHLQIFDIILYVLSGILLIFLMEQFVRIGINMQSI